MNTPAPGWLPDPTGRHEYRYWDGSRWTDDISDQGTIGNDAYAGPTGPTPPTAGFGAPVAPGGYGDPTAAPSYGDPTATAPYGDPTAAYGSGAYGSPYGAAPQPQPSGPPVGLIVGLVVLVVALIGGLGFIVANQGDDDDDSARTAANTEDTNDTTVTTASPTTSEPTGTTLDVGDLPEGSDDVIAGVMADSLVTASNGVLTHEEADCLATGMIDAVGTDRLIEAGNEVVQNGTTNPFEVYTPEELSAISQVLLDCVPADKLDDLTSVFGDVLDQAGTGG